ncbi:carboxypeptidase regulatory-like domain-containing protein [Myxococcus sp. CA051A]|uniref:carboxypeptidase regulatory-like domain-containing protein n=1 Tax=Myxococcus sp. CA051A TaxID=2741739 RepID=UPI00157B26DF|nr:carboxypeptidase regulatory-like domain-containing protein [Myxococcus sp. CA051A]NTX60690.1 carboxypeptidase regulatory-like domain-containing protein [Myxococcus sp. CA051A]
MRLRSQRPIFFAALLAIGAVLLLWFRVPRPGTPSDPAPSAPRETQASSSGGGVTARAESVSAAVRDEPAAPDEGAFVVRVVGASGPVAGANVRAWRKQSKDLVDAAASSWRLAAEGTTGEDGTLRLPTRPGDYLLSAHAEGHAPARREATRPAGEAETSVELTLSAGVTLQGRTVAENGGEPVPLAEVTLHPYPGAAIAWAEPAAIAEEAVTATSDERGQFQFTGLAPGRYGLTAEAPGFSRRTLRFLHVPQQGELVVGLWGAGTLEGFVVDGKGQPVTGAQVTASGGRAPVSTTSSEGGGFALEVGGGDWVLSARHGDAVGRVPGTLFVAPGETLRGLTVALGSTSGLTGQVRSTGDEAPVRGAVLVVSPTGADGELARTTSGGEGIYRLGLPPGEYDVQVHAPGFASATHDGVVVSEGAHATLDVKLEPATAEVEGVVVNPQGQPVAGAEVRAQPPRNGGGAAATTRTDSQGAYTLSGLVPGRTSVRARRDGSQGWTSRTETLKAGTRTRVDLTLTESGMVQGVVTQSSGKPLSEPAVVRAVPRGAPGGTSDLAWAETDAAGLYELELPAGVYQLTAVLPRARFIYFQDDDPSVTVQAGSAVQQDLVLVEERGISGTVREPSGAPSPFAVVAAVQGGDMPFTMRVQADENGTFAIPTRPSGAPPLQELAAHNGGRVVRVPSVREGQGLMDLRLKPAAHLRGRVVARGGAVPAGFTLRLTEDNGEELPWEPLAPSTRRFSGDTFEMRDAPGQVVKVHVQTQDGRTGSARVALEPGGSANVEVSLSTGGAASIIGRAVWSRGGGPAAGVAVFLDRAVTARPDTVTGVDGRFHLDEVRPGPHTVRLMPPEGRVETHSVKVTEAETSDLGDVTVSPRRATPGTVGAGFSEERGQVAVAWLTPDGPAARAGVAVGDRLLAVDGLVVRDRSEAEARTRGAPGTPVRLQVRREGGERELQATRAE